MKVCITKSKVSWGTIVQNYFIYPKFREKNINLYMIVSLWKMWHGTLGFFRGLILWWVICWSQVWAIIWSECSNSGMKLTVLRRKIMIYYEVLLRKKVNHVWKQINSRRVVRKGLGFKMFLDRYHSQK